MPVPPLVPTTPSPLPTDQNADFDAKAFPWAASLNPFGESLVDIGEFVEASAVQVDADAIAVAADRVQTGLDRVQTGQDRAAAEAAALAAGVSSGLVLTGRAGNFVRVNPGETALEFLDGGVLSQLATTLAGSSASGIEINRQGTGDRAAFVDFHSHGLPGANDNSARILRQAGANGAFDIVQSGTGAIRLLGNTQINGTIGGTVIPSQAVAEAGTDNASVMTPLRTAQAIAALTPPSAPFGLTLLNSVAASGASVTISGLNAAKSYFVEFINLRCANAGPQKLQVAFSSNGGSTFRANSAISVSQNWNGSGCRGGMFVYKPAAKAAGETCSDLGTSANAFTIQFQTLTGLAEGTNAIRFTYPLGNFNNGSFNIYEVS